MRRETTPNPQRSSEEQHPEQSLSIAPACARLTGLRDGETLRLDLSPGRWVLGSGPLADLRIKDPSISRQHAALIVEGAPSRRLQVEDLGSRNGTRMDGAQVTSVELESGRTITFGTMAFELSWLDPSDTAVATGADGAQPQPPATVSESIAGATVDLTPAIRLVREVLPEMIRQVSSGSSTEELAGWLGSALEEAGFSSVEIRTAATPHAVLFAPDPEQATDGEPPDVVVSHRHPNHAFELHAATRGDLDAQAALRSTLDLLEIAASGASTAPAADQAQDADPPEPPKPPSRTPALRNAYEQARRVAPSHVAVLVRGESGTGKELLVRYLHANAKPANRPFVAINCAALPKDLLEAELFGIEKGVATGVTERAGRFEQANGGTLFLDEIGDMPAETQAMILRVLQEKTVQRIGGAEHRPAQVRIVAATNRDLAQMVDDGLFRQDLYYRLAGSIIDLPPLRARRADVVNLAAFFLAREAVALGKTARGISEAAAEALQNHDWPGNVRELETAMARAASLIPDGQLLDRTDLPAAVLAGPTVSQDATLAERVGAFERAEIVRALEQSGQDVNEAAATLGISRATLYRKSR